VGRISIGNDDVNPLQEQIESVAGERRASLSADRGLFGGPAGGPLRHAIVRVTKLSATNAAFNGSPMILAVPDRIGSAAGEWHDVILPKTGTGTACFAGRWTGMLPLEFPRHLTRSVLSCRERARSDGESHYDKQGQNSHQRVHAPFATWICT
jgi:hypothetical protein